MNKVISRLLTLILVFIIMSVSLIGCHTHGVTFDGIENKRLTKDLNILRNLLVESVSTSEYKEEEISDILTKINDNKYQKKLSGIEVLLIKDITDIQDTIKQELTQNHKVITWTTFQKVDWLLQAEE